MTPHNAIDTLLMNVEKEKVHIQQGPLDFVN